MSAIDRIRGGRFRYAFGLAMLLGVVAIWVASAELMKVWHHVRLTTMPGQAGLGQTAKTSVARSALTVYLLERGDKLFKALLPDLLQHVHVLPVSTGICFSKELARSTSCLAGFQVCCGLRGAVMCLYAYARYRREGSFAPGMFGCCALEFDP